MSCGVGYCAACGDCLGCYGGEFCALTGAYHNDQIPTIGEEMNPVITNVTVLYPNGQSYLSPGQTGEILVDALDGDNRTITITVKVTDSSGGEVANVVTVVASDPLTYEASSTDSGVAVTQDPTQPNRFFVTLAA